MSTLTGTPGTDRLTGTLGADTIKGLAGNDVLTGRAGADYLDGGDGADTLYGGGGADTLVGGAGNDVLSGGAGKDLFLYGAGDGQDRVTDFASGDIFKVSDYSSAQSVVQVGADVVVTFSAGDKVMFTGTSLATVQAGLHFGSTGGGGAGTITGTAGDDVLNGTASADTIQGLGGDDTINGGGGNDRIIGGAGADSLMGGPGSDTFVYLSLSDSVGGDIIKDWSSVDRIDLSAIDANALLAGDQAFHIYWTGFDGMPPTHTNPGDLSITAFGGEIYITAYTDNVPGADLMITCWCDAGLAALTPDNIIG